MGLFGVIFGVQSTYSAKPRSISRDKIRMLVSPTRSRTVDSKEEPLIEKTIIDARTNGKISLRKIEEVLRSLVSKHEISINDKKGVLAQFEEYFEKKK